MKLIALALCASAAFAADYLPLQQGNTWTYRDPATGQTFTVRAGTPLATMDGRTYHRLMGYAERDVWARTLENGTIVYLDEEAEKERILTSFEKVEGGWAEAPLRACEHESQVDGKGGSYKGRAGVFSDAVTLNYRTFSCADTGIVAEVYAPNVGMLSRTVQTIAGPRILELVEARVGGFSFTATPAAGFTAAMEHAPDGGLMAKLRLTVDSGEAIDLMYPDSQDYDIVIWDETGRQVYRWSDGKAFAQAARWVTIVGRRSHDVAIETPAMLGDGRYLMEAWVTAGPSRRSFAAMTPFTITDGKLVR
ncbi:MAG: hypothetical protein IH602_09430 [Bryobacteraceae bacterium]|nr:hypothetical protein [Bryobacteraceae bacterium]